MKPTNSELSASLRKWAAQIQVDTIDKASMALDLILAAQRLETISDADPLP